VNLWFHVVSQEP